MADLNLARQLATGIVEALKTDGHILIAKGKGEALLRELAEHIQPTLVLVMPRVLRSEVHGEVSSTFGDEATDEAVESLVETLREALIDSEGVEDVFAEDNVMERVIFRALSAELVTLARIAGEDEEDKPPISVRLGTLGYVAATAAKLSDQETLRDALERAALSASTVLDTFDAESRTAIFTAREDDPDKRLEIEEAVEEELADLVDMGIVDLPHVDHVIALPKQLSDVERKTIGKSVTAVADRTLTSRMCPATWEWQGDRSIKLTFTPLSEPDAHAVGELASFQRGVEALFAEGASPVIAERVKERAAIESILRAASGQKAPITARGGELRAKADVTPPSSRRGSARPVIPAPPSSRGRTVQSADDDAPVTSRSASHAKSAPPPSSKGAPISSKDAPPSPVPGSTRSEAPSSKPTKAAAKPADEKRGKATAKTKTGDKLPKQTKSAKPAAKKKPVAKKPAKR